jgi:probable HAF family extracellular repeat protein
VGVGYSNRAQGCQSPLCIITTAQPMAYGPGQGPGQELSRGGHIIGRAFGINASGAICGELYNTLTSGDTVPVKWPSAVSEPTMLATLGGANGDTWRISDDGSVYGWSMTAAGEHRATAWSPLGTPSDLGTLAGAASSDAQDGRPGVGIVGFCTFGSGASATNRGVLFQNGAAVELTPRVAAVVGANSVNVRVASAINSRGWISAYGTIDGTETVRGMILVPCPPVLVAPTLVVTCPGGGLTITVQGAEGATSLRWRRGGQPLTDGTVNGVTISGAATATLTLSGLHTTDAGLFDCVATTPCGEATSAPTRLLVGPADIGSAGGLAGADGHYDNNDFIVFITDFFAQDFHADLGSAGGVIGSDGAFDNNDFIAFINLFFTGC